MPKQADVTLQMNIHQFLVYGRKAPTVAEPNPEIICLRVFAKNEVFAKSLYWKISSKLHKFKRSQGEILKVQRISEKNTTSAKNYGIYFRYRTRTGQENAFKEFRAISLQHAITQLYCEMGSIQKVTKESISIIRTCTMSFNDCKVRNPRSLRYKQSGTLAVPHWQQRVRPDNKQHRTIFNANKPALFKTGKSIEN